MESSNKSEEEKDLPVQDTSNGQEREGDCATTGEQTEKEEITDKMIGIEEGEMDVDSCEIDDDDIGPEIIETAVQEDASATETKQITEPLDSIVNVETDQAVSDKDTEKVTSETENMEASETESINFHSELNKQLEEEKKESDKGEEISDKGTDAEKQTEADVPETTPQSDTYKESMSELKMIFKEKDNSRDTEEKEPSPSKAAQSDYANQFEQFLMKSQSDAKETTDMEQNSNNDSLDNASKMKENIDPPSTGFKPIPEENSSSSWYKIKDNREQPMETSETQDISPDNASVVSSNIGDSCMSYQDQASNDEASNLSAPGDSVPQYTGHQPDFDESANINPPENVTFLRPDTPSSTINEATSESTPAKKTRRGTLQIAAEDASEHGHNITAADIFEYQWPQEPDGDYYILQEQLSIYLDVKSFKRKYPDLFRRVCDKHEKDFLRDKGVVSETQSDLGLTALKSDEVHDVMGRDYPSKYKEFLKVIHERERQKMAIKMKEHENLKLEKDKMIEYTKKAMKSASDWNRNMLKEKNEERRAYFDTQTFTIQYPKHKFWKFETVKTEVTAYPLSLIPGQFQDYFRKYTSEELKYFPLNTALFDPPKKVDHLARHQQLQQLEQEEAESQEDDASQTVKTGTGSVSSSDSEDDSSSSSGESENKENGDTVTKPKKEKSTSREASKEKSVDQKILEGTSLQPVVKLEIMECRICKDEKKQSKQKVDEELIRCSECKGSGHPSCLDLTDDMVKIIKTYPWQCMECKTCVQCMDPYDEDKMMFCDKCDRGYHTFCVGLKSLPTGHWECKSCRGDSTPVKPIPRPTPKSKKGRKPLGKGTPKPESGKDENSRDSTTKEKPVMYITKSGRETPLRDRSKLGKSLREKPVSKDIQKSASKESSRSSFKDGD